MSSSSTFVAADGDGYELQMGRWSRHLALPITHKYFNLYPAA